VRTVNPNPNPRYKAAQWLQAQLRGMMSRKEAKRRRRDFNMAARRIQRLYREYQCRHDISTTHRHASHIQKTFRGFSSRRLSQGWMRQRLRAARIIQRFLSRRIWRREIGKLKYHRACVKVQTLWRRERAVRAYRGFYIFICKCQSRARIRGTLRHATRKRGHFRDRILRWCGRFEDFSRVATNQIFVEKSPNIERERTNLLKTLHEFHRPIRALFLKYAVRGVSDPKKLNLRITWVNFMGFSVELGLTAPLDTQGNPIKVKRGTSSLNDEEAANAGESPLGGAFMDLTQTGDFRYPKENPLSATDIEGVFKTSLNPPNTLHQDPDWREALKTHALTGRQAKDSEKALLAGEFVEALVRLALLVYRNYADTKAKGALGYHSNSYRVRCLLTAMASDALDVPESCVFGDDSDVVAMLGPSEAASVEDRTAARNTLIMYENKLRKVHKKAASSKKGTPVALSPGDFNSIMMENKVFDKKEMPSKYPVAALTLEAFIASNRDEIGQFLEELPRVTSFAGTLWLEYIEFEEALCRCAIMKGKALGFPPKSPEVQKFLEVMCRNTAKLAKKFTIGGE